MHNASTTGVHIVCLFLLRTFTSKGSNLITVVTSAFLLVFAILGFGALLLTCLVLFACLALARPFN